MLALVGCGGAAKDGVAESFVFIPTPWTVPGLEDSGLRGMGGEVALLGPHLMDMACHEFAWAHEGVRGQGQWVRVVCRSGGCRLPFTYQEGPSPALKDTVGSFHGVRRREAGGVTEKMRVCKGSPRKGPQQGKRNIG